MAGLAHIDIEERLRIESIVEMSVNKTLAKLGIKEAAVMSQHKAYKKYGQSVVKRWIKNGLIDPPVRKGTGKTSTKVYLVEQLERAMESEKNVALKIKK